jgi:hypothetical protein
VRTLASVSDARRGGRREKRRREAANDAGSPRSDATPRSNHVACGVASLRVGLRWCDRIVYRVSERLVIKSATHTLPSAHKTGGRVRRRFGR